MPLDEVIDEIGYEITGPGYTFLEFALTAEMSFYSSSMASSSTSYSSSTASTSTTTPIYDAEWTRTVNAALTSAIDMNTVTGSVYSATNTITMAFPSASSSSSSSFPSAYAPAYPTSVNATSADGASGSASDPAPASGGTSDKTASVLKGVLGTIGGLAVLLVFIFCVKRRRAKRRIMGDPEMSQIVDAATTRPVVTHTESIGIVALPPPLARYSRIVDASAAPALPPRTRLSPSPRYRDSVVSSSWADDSEMDAFATDGSSIARTLSTHSNDSRASDATIRTTENPFDHPAYTTLLPSSRRTRSTPTGTLLTASSPIDPFSDGHAAQASGSAVTLLDSAPSPISPLSPAVTTSRRSPADTLEDMFADLTDEDSGGLSRGATIIRHVDAGSAPRGRQGQPEPERIGGGEVHIPPTYMELYPRQGARLPR